ncbi:hypothetical protein CTI12_AA538640 [Artemisia annua]|uniref:Uncharacterized protein n=1 Tax=Artemisia annua TaxID=35608 RepID=A0A2U1L0Z5_ARTAN|nr:hypothetical protein CTI12_AA538640 [Artemisia annua]
MTLKSTKEKKRKLNERMKLLRKLAAGPNTCEKIRARIEAESKKHKENGWVHDPMVHYRIMYTDLQKYGTEFGVSSQHSKDLCKLKREAIAIKEHFKTILLNNKKDIHSLLPSIEDVIQIVTHFYKETRDVPYNWRGRMFIPDLKRGTKIVYPKPETFGQPDHVLEFKYADESDEEDNEAQGKDVMVTDPMDFHLDILDAKIHMLVSRVGLYGLFAIVPNVCYPNKIDEKIWKEFEDFDNEECYELDDLLMRSVLEPFSIEVDHPIVSAIGNFAVKAFNKACEMHVKKSQHNNLHDFELMECKYIKTATSYYFFMVIEALEEGKRGVYEANVICNSFGGCMILCQFVLTGRKPFGTKEMSGKYFKCLQSICETVEQLYLEKLTRLEALYECLEGDERCKAQVYKDRLKKQHTDAVEALHWRLNSLKRTRLPDCNQMTVPDAWSHPDKDKTGMIRRAMDSGYDLYNLLD